MKVSISLLIVLLATLSQPSLASEPGTSRTSDMAPRITIPETVFDFGTLLEGETANHTFAIENTGDAPLVIDRIKTTCGCTTADYTRGEIGPGARGEVTLQVNTEGYGGKTISKSATVFTNCPKPKSLKLLMKGTVSVFAEIHPKTIKLVGSPEEAVRAVVRITPTEAYPFRIVGEPETGKAAYRCTLEEKSGTYILTAENLATEDTIYFETVLLKTDHPKNPEIKIQVIGKIKTLVLTDDGR